MKNILCLLLLITCSTNALCINDSLTKRKKKDHKRTVVLSMSNFVIAGITAFDPYLGPYINETVIANQFGVSFEQEVSRRIRIGISYAAWNANERLGIRDPHPEPLTSFEHNRRYIRAAKEIDNPGDLRHRYGYKMVDAIANYRYDGLPRHRFNAGLGASYTWGTNYYLFYRVFSTKANDYLYYIKQENGSYIGIICPVRYDFLFLRNRFAFGVQGTARKYFGLESLQIDYGFHLSVNF